MINPYVQYMYSYPHKTAYRSLQDVNLRQYSAQLTGGGHSLYLHVPFCQTKCGYCNLFSVTGQNKEDLDQYLDAVERQCIQYAELFHACSTVFSELVIGGGTPLYLHGSQLERIFQMLAQYITFSDHCERVIETAPNQTTMEKLDILQQAGITRISVGIQSLDEQELKTLGRHHSARQAKEALARIKEYAFPCVNVDLIYGIPGQTEIGLLTNIREILLFEPDEIFLYPLYIKHGAGLVYTGMAVNTEYAYYLYQKAADLLVQAGYRQDSMRRFVRGQEVRMFRECGLASSLALGCGGRSYLGRLHFCSPYTITRQDCLNTIKEYERTKDYTVITNGILLSDEERKRRYLIKHLFVRPGLSLKQYQARFQSRAMDDFPILKSWQAQGYVVQHTLKTVQAEPELYLSLTECGLGLSDYLGPQLISPRIKRAMEEWEEQHGYANEAHGFIPGQHQKL